MHRKMSTVASLTALAFVFSYLEAIFPFSVGIPGVKLGLANVIVLIALYRHGAKPAICVSLLRVLLTGFTYTGLLHSLYGLVGGTFSLAVMVLLKKSKAFSIVGVSVSGAVLHNLGQLLVAIVLTNTLQIAFYLPALLASGVITGVAIGLSAHACIKRLAAIDL